MACNSETPQYCAWSNTIKSRLSFLDLRGAKSTKLPIKNYVTSVLKVDCEQSLFFFRVHVRSSVERRSRETRETRAAAREEKGESFFCRASPVSSLQSRAWSFACLGRNLVPRAFPLKNGWCSTD